MTNKNQIGQISEIVSDELSRWTQNCERLLSEEYRRNDQLRQQGVSFHKRQKNVRMKSLEKYLASLRWLQKNYRVKTEWIDESAERLNKKIGDEETIRFFTRLNLTYEY